MGSWRWAGRVALGTLMVVVLGACAALDWRSPPEIVTQRARERWDALLKRDYERAYGYLSPASRSTMTLDRYRSTITPGFWKSVTVGKVSCESGEVCTVDTTVEYTFKGQTNNTPFKEKWIKDGSQWWLVQN